MCDVLKAKQKGKPDLNKVDGDGEREGDRTGKPAVVINCM